MNRCDHPGCIGVAIGCMQRAVGPLYCAGHKEWAEEANAAYWAAIDEAMMDAPDYDESGEMCKKEEQSSCPTSSSVNRGPVRLVLCRRSAEP